MTSTRKLHDLGQSLWLDNLTRELLDEGTLRRYIEELSIAGPTSNPTINPVNACSSNWHWRIFAVPRICSARYLTPAITSMAGSRWKSRRCWPVIPMAADRTMLSHNPVFHV